ncbi:unnamed protein product [Thelazia callipaeda]|uniref:DC_STAMP domain-containing protein n=1 Tax=Thelazia callipaeda TaxID=103827 RepID=A0A0N5D7N4_THECL|nr:unnamed protein product [Thelazia callipaeda]
MVFNCQELTKNFLVEPYREERRIRLGRSKFLDIFFYSGVYDYQRLRVIINLPTGFLISALLYKFAWHRINFLDFNPIAEQILKWIVIVACAIAFAGSPLFRCAIICVLFGALGKNGQNLLTVIVINNLSYGPVENIVQNFKVSTNMITCHIKQKEDMMAQRVILSTGPIEAFMAEHFGKIQNSCFFPATSREYNFRNMQKQMLFNFVVSTTVQSENLRSVRHSSDLSSLYKGSEHLYTLLNVTEAISFCDQMTNQVISRTKNLDSDLTDAYNLSESVMDHLRVNLHYKAVVEPQIVRVYSIKEVQYKIAQNFHLLKNYLNNIDFNNVFLTPYFWHIDEKRRNDGQIFLYPLSKAEIQANKLMTPFSPPTKTEIGTSWLPLAKFIFLFIISCFVTFIDFVFYKIIYSISKYTEKDIVTESQQFFSFKFLILVNFNLNFVCNQIDGTGFIADLVKDLLEFDYAKHANMTISLEECKYNPVSPDWVYAGKYIFFPLGIMFLLQVIFGYVIKRLTLFYVIGNIFRKRCKARIIHLYNKMLFVRINGRKLARARIRFQVQRRILHREYIEQKRQAKFYLC